MSLVSSLTGAKVIDRMPGSILVEGSEAEIASVVGKKKKDILAGTACWGHALTQNGLNKPFDALGANPERSETRSTYRVFCVRRELTWRTK
jgi:hypothetical protein